MNQIKESFLAFFEALKVSAPQITVGIVVLILFVFLGLIAGRGLKNLLIKTKISQKKAHLLRRLVRWFFYSFGIVFALNIMGLTRAASGILAAGGILTVVLGFAFREIGENLLAGFFMSFSRSFDVGDLIQSNGIEGIVKEISIRDVHVRTGDGVDIFIPSAMIFKNPLNNYTRDGLRRGRFLIGIDYRNDSENARTLILESVNSSKGVLVEPEASIQIVNFNPNYVELEVFFWINTFSEHPNLSEVRSEVMDLTRTTLLNNEYTVSSEVSTTVQILKD